MFGTTFTSLFSQHRLENRSILFEKDYQYLFHHFCFFSLFYGLSAQ